MRSICFFASYFTSEELPYYIQVYLLELKKQYKEVVLFTSQKELDKTSRIFLENEKIELRIEHNTGFDFGMWYKAFQSYPVIEYDQIVLVNDSCVLFRSLNDFTDWASQNPADFKGISLSEAISTHLQSYFLLLNKASVKHAIDYFNKHGVLSNIKEVIHTYEIGLSSYLLSKGLSMAAFIDNNSYRGEYSPYYYCIDHHLAQGIPLIKKKILFASYRKDELFTLARMNFNVSARYYIDSIKKQNTNLIIDFEKLKGINEPELRGFLLVKYNINRVLIKTVRAMKHLFE